MALFNYEPDKFGIYGGSNPSKAHMLIFLKEETRCFKASRIKEPGK